MQIEHDLHIHTYLSACCKAKDIQTPRNIIRMAEEMGLSAIGFSGRVWENKAVEPSKWYQPQDESHIARLRTELSEISADIRILSLAREAGCLFTLGTDAHYPARRQSLYELEYFSYLLEISESDLHPAVQGKPPGTNACIILLYVVQ